MPRIHGSLRHVKLFIFPVLFIGLFLLLGACNESETGQVQVDTVAADSTGDSTAVATSDSAAAVEESGGFFARFRRNGDNNDENDEAEDEREVVPVELAVVRIDDVPSYLSSTASLEPEKQVDVIVKINGQIERMLVEEGDIVSAGQILATLDGAVQRVQLREASIRADNTEREFRRSDALYQQQGISEKEFQDIRFRYEEAQAQLEAAQLEMDRCEIKAPFAGFIAERLLDQGQHVNMGAQVFRLVDADPLLARIFLPEKEAVHIDAGQPVVISPDTHPGLELPGEVLRMAPIVDRRTGTVKVTCRISQMSALRPGSFVRVQVQTDMHPQVPVIPKRALVPEGGEIYVFKAVADSVIKVSIKTGYSNGTVVEIIEGLEIGDQVVSVGTGSLKMGSRVRALNESEIETQNALANSTPMGEI
ncbi:MAG: efflux RND transporter periplasmic adaptor subunit [bacterium]|nr:efflux RND transporter periplasmic adaptor subunit [bacterium]